MTNCHNTATVSGEHNVGGVVGEIPGASNGGKVTACCNTGTITGSSSVGGVVGDGGSGSQITNCYNTGAVNGNNTVGGVVGNTYNGSVSHCYNTGTVTTSGNTAKSVCGLSEGSTVTNCYYLDTTPADDYATPKTADEFASGEVAWLLQGEQGDQVWGQGLKDSPDEYPVLTKDSEKKVYKVTFRTEGNDDYAAKYTNNGGTVDLPDEPTLEGTAFDHWSTENSTSGGEKFDNTTPVTEDITLYAVGQKTFGGESGEITLTTTYGKELTDDLSKHIEYESDTATAGKFTYEITGGNSELKATIEGDNLKIPGTAKARTYTLTIKATEKAPEYSLMSVDTYGTGPVTLTVKVIINKANSTVQTAPTANALTYTGDPQALVTAGEAVGGTLQYSLDGSNYSAAIPTGIEANKYTVYYKVVGDDNYNGTEPVPLTVTIAKAETNITANPVTYTYGTPGGITLTATVAPVVANGISLMSAEQNQVVFTFPKDGKIKTVDNVPAEGGTVTVNIPAEEVKEYLNSGENKVTVSYGGSGNLNGKASVTVTVTVNPKTLTFYFTPKDKIYDGNTTIEGTFDALTNQLVSGDSVEIEAFTATTADKNAGADKPVTVTVT